MGANDLVFHRTLRENTELSLDGMAIARIAGRG